MTQRQVTITHYTLDSHPNPERVMDWVRSYWHDLFDGSDEIQALNEFCAHFGLTITQYQLSLGSHSYVRFETDVDDLRYMRLWKWLEKRMEGVPDGSWITAALIQPLQEFIQTPRDITLRELFDECLRDFITDYINEWSDCYDDDSIRETCLVNNYYFTEAGAFAGHGDGL